MRRAIVAAVLDDTARPGACTKNLTPADDGYEVLVIRRERQITAEEAQS